MSTKRASAVASGGVLTLSLILAGCSGGTTTTPSAGSGASSAAAAPRSQSPSGAVSAEHNDTDIAFAQRMIPHHQQAIEMAEIAGDRAQRAEVKTLAEEIRTAQGPEITQLIDFLAAWGAEAPPPGSMSGGMTGMNTPNQTGMTAMNGASMPGMMTNGQMQQLRDASGAPFDTMFLQMMIVHHRGAVADAQQEVDGGSNPQATQLASKIVADQYAEIDRMQKLLA